MARSGMATPEETRSIGAHLVELRNRLIVVSVVLLVASTLAYVFRDALLSVLTLPLGPRELISLTPAGGFAFIFNVSLFTGAAVSLPVLAYQLYQFLAPTMRHHARRTAAIIAVSSAVLMVSGMLYAYFFAIPGALKFLFEFPEQYVDVSQLTADSYLAFIVKYMAGVGIVFQIPIVLMLLHWIRPLTTKGLLASEKWVILGAFIVAAFITPTPDPINQTVIALPVILVYQIGVVLVLLSLRRQRQYAPQPVHPPLPHQVEAAPRQQAGSHPLPSQTAVHQVPHPRRPAVRSIDGITPPKRRPARRDDILRK